MLHTVVVSYNRLELLKRTLASYLETMSIPFSLVVIDNGSEDETRTWLLHDSVDSGVYLLTENHYPGYAANYGFELAPDEATLLHRSDNDIEYLPGWCDEVLDRFEDKTLGQLGLRTVEEEGEQPNVGGNCIIRRELFDAGLRYDDRPWTEMPFEDTNFSHLVRRQNYRVGRVQRPCTVHIGVASSTDPYYQKTFAERHITFAEYGIK